MLESISLALLGLAILFTILTFERKRIEYGAFSVLFWLISMAGLITVEVPYALWNNVDNLVTEGTTKIYTQAPLAIVCFAIAIVMILVLMWGIWKE